MSLPPASDENDAFRLALCVAVRGRVDFLRRRVPLWAKAGFSEVVVSDNSTERGDRSEIQSLCQSFGFVYVPIVPRLVDQRCVAWNDAIRRSRSSWILIQSDDDEIIRQVNLRYIGEAARGVDYLMPRAGTGMLAPERGGMPILFRREFALRVGGYPEFLAGGEDHALLRKFQRAGRSGAFDARLAWTDVDACPHALIPHPVSTVRNLFWYNLGLLAVLRFVPYPKRFLWGVPRDAGRYVREALGQKGGWLVAAAGLLAIATGLALAPAWYLLHRREVSEIRGAR